MSLENERTMGCDKSSTSKYTPFSVSKDLLNRVIEEDQDAYTELDLAIRPRLLGYFYRRLPQEAEDLAQNSIIRITASIDKFRGDSERPFSHQFTSWCFAIARNTLYTELAQMAKRNRSFTPQNLDGDDRSFDETISDLYYHSHPYDAVSADPLPKEVDDEKLGQIDFNQFLDNWFDRNLTERQQYIVARRKAGKGNSEIADELGLYRSTIGKKVMKIKSKVETNLLRPARFRPLKEFRDEDVVGLSKKSLDSAVEHGKLKVIRVLGRLYTSLECIGEYLAERRDSLDKTQALSGLVYIGNYTSPVEYFTLLRNSQYRRLLVFISGRAYIHPEDLEDIKRKRNQKEDRFAEKLPPDEAYVALRTIVKTAAVYSRYRTAIVEGRLEAVKKDRNFWVKPEVIAEYNERYKSRDANNKKPEN